MSRPNTILFILFHVFLPLLVGSLIYLIFRLEAVSQSSTPNFLIFSTLIYSLPDSCWLYAMLSSLLLIWKNQADYWFQFWIVLTFICAIGTEIFQSQNIIPGTFDLFDIIFYSLAFILFIIINKIQFIKNKTLSL
jgi:hypothetical protein